MYQQAQTNPEKAIEIAMIRSKVTSNSVRQVAKRLLLQHQNSVHNAQQFHELAMNAVKAAIQNLKQTQWLYSQYSL